MRCYALGEIPEDLAEELIVSARKLSDFKI
jgi:hypothetical protein